MEYTQTVDDNKNIIFVKIKGPVTTEGISPLAVATRAKATELNYLLLFDFRESTNYVSIYDAQRWLFDHYDKIDFKLKFTPAAHVINGETEEFFSFVETAWGNRGAQVKLFKDKDLAIEWLDKINSQKMEGEIGIK